jgi:hypothetical protein
MTLGGGGVAVARGFYVFGPPTTALLLVSRWHPLALAKIIGQLKYLNLCLPALFLRWKCSTSISTVQFNLLFQPQLQRAAHPFSGSAITTDSMPIANKSSVDRCDYS